LGQGNTRIANNALLHRDKY